MDQERVAMKIVDVYKFTGEVFLKTLYYAIEASYNTTKNRIENRSFIKETNWNRFMGTSEAKHFQTFLSEEINSERLKSYLEDYGVGFSIKDNKDGTSTIAIDAKNVKALEESFNKVVNDLTDPQKAVAVNKKLIKSPANMTITEKISHYKKKMQQEIKANSAVKKAAPNKAKIKAGKEI